MKRLATVMLCFVIFAVGLWVISGSRTLDSACALSARTTGNQACISGTPFFLLGVGLCVTGVVSLVVALWTMTRRRRSTSLRHEPSAVSTLHRDEVESLRDVA